MSLEGQSDRIGPPELTGLPCYGFALPAALIVTTIITFAFGLFEDSTLVVSWPFAVMAFSVVNLRSPLPVFHDTLLKRVLNMPFA